VKRLSQTVQAGSLYAVLLVLALLAACSEPSTAPKKAVVPTPVDPATAGKIQIEVRYNGVAPTPKVLDMRSVPQCAEAHTEPVYDDSLLVHDGHLANAVVWIKSGLEGWVFAPPDAPVVIDQKGCLYQPHVATAMVNQPVEYLNSDREAHNVHGRPDVVSAWNFLLSRPGATRTLSFDKPEVAIPVGCDIHPWMRGYLAVVPNPYAAVTPPSGTVTLSQVPPGKYVISVWHEKLGTKEQSITLEPSGSLSVPFELSAKN
jgi:plastocyanin